MTSRDFCYWLQGAIEICNPDTFTTEQVKIIKAHLSLVFKHEIDPSMGDKEHQEMLNGIHNLSKSFSIEDENGEKMRC